MPISPEIVDIISKFGLMGAGAYLIVWVTRYFDRTQRELNKRMEKQQDEANKRHQQGLEKIYNAMDKLADKYGDLSMCSKELKDCYLSHDEQAKIILNGTEANRARIDELDRTLRSMITNCERCRLNCVPTKPE